MKKVVLITGGGRGIGAATARLAARHDYTVCIDYVRNREAAVNLVRDIEDSGGTAFAFEGDVSKEDHVVKLFEEVDVSLVLIVGLAGEKCCNDTAPP